MPAQTRARTRMPPLKWTDELSPAEILAHFDAGGDIVDFPAQGVSCARFNEQVFAAMVEAKWAPTIHLPVEYGVWVKRVRQFVRNAYKQATGGHVSREVRASLRGYVRAFRVVREALPPKGHAWPLNIVRAAIVGFWATYPGSSTLQAVAKGTPCSLKKAISSAGLQKEFALQAAQMSMATENALREIPGYTGMSPNIVPAPLLLVSANAVGVFSAAIGHPLSRSIDDFVCLGVTETATCFAPKVMVELITRACKLGAIVGIGAPEPHFDHDVVAKAFKGLPVVVFQTLPGANDLESFACETVWSVDHRCVVLVGDLHPCAVSIAVKSQYGKHITPTQANAALRLLTACFDVEAHSFVPPDPDRLSHEEFRAKIACPVEAFKDIIPRAALPLPACLPLEDAPDKDSGGKAGSPRKRKAAHPARGAAKRRRKGKSTK